jgi:hypothetical protein
MVHAQTRSRHGKHGQVSRYTSRVTRLLTLTLGVTGSLFASDVLSQTAEGLRTRERVLNAAVQARPHDPEVRLGLAKFLHYRGVEGDTAAAERAYGLLTQLESERPDDPVLRAYLGSAHLLAATRVWVPWQKGKLSLEGLTLLDQAVAQAEENLEIRFLRGASTYYLPFFFHREEKAAEDFAWVAARARSAVAADRLDPTLAAAAFFFDGECRAKRADYAGAYAAWQAAREIGPDTKAGAKAASRLDEMRRKNAPSHTRE